jgi:hypothetical protein
LRLGSVAQQRVGARLTAQPASRLFAKPIRKLAPGRGRGERRRAGLLEQIVDCGAVIGEDRDADVRARALAGRGQDALGGDERLDLVRVERNQHRERIRAERADVIGCAHDAAQAVGQRLAAFGRHPRLLDVNVQDGEAAPAAQRTAHQLLDAA